MELCKINIKICKTLKDALLPLSRHTKQSSQMIFCSSLKWNKFEEIKWKQNCWYIQLHNAKWRKNVENLVFNYILRHSLRPSAERIFIADWFLIGDAKERSFSRIKAIVGQDLCINDSVSHTAGPIPHLETLFWVGRVNSEDKSAT